LLGKKPVESQVFVVTKQRRTQLLSKFKQGLPPEQGAVRWLPDYTNVLPLGR